MKKAIGLTIAALLGGILSGCIPITLVKVSGIDGLVTFHENTPVRSGTVELKGPVTTTVLTDNEGRFTVGRLPTGIYTVFVYLDDELVHSEPLRVTSKTESLAVKLGDDVNVQILQNPGFEKLNEKQHPIGWGSQNIEQDGKFTLETEQPYEGLYAVRLEGTHDQARIAMSQTVPFYEHYVDYVFRLSAYYRSSDVGKSNAVGVRLIFKDEGGEDIEIIKDANFAILSPGLVEDVDYGLTWGKHLWLYAEQNADEWQYIEIEFTPPQDAVNIIVSAFLDRTPGTIWWDNVKLELIPKGES